MGGMSKRVGIIGVGLLGGALGQRLAGQGWEVSVSYTHLTLPTTPYV